MIYPTVVLDNFFTNPDTIRDFALSLPYERDADGRWPGERSPMLHTHNEDLVFSFAKKIISIYYDNGMEVFWDGIQMAFQKIKPYSSNKNSLLNKGWIHTDGRRSFAGVVYLTPYAPLDTGTTIFGLKQEHHEHTQGEQEVKSKLYRGLPFDEKEYNTEIEELYNKFKVVTEVKNVYNRCIQYDAQQWHSGTNYHTEGEDRLSLIYFFTNVRSEYTPYQRMIHHDQEIINKIKEIT